MIFRAKNNGGYTLLEIILAISISALILLAAAPSLGGFINERRLRNAVDFILECAAEARLAAKQQGETVFLSIRKGEMETPNGKRRPLPKDMKLLLKTETNEWTTTKKNWAFFPNGIVEPLSLRLERGSSWIELDIDPLTGMVAEERFSF